MIRLKVFTPNCWDVEVDGLLVGALTRVKGCEWYYTDLKTMVREPLDVPTEWVRDVLEALLKHLAVPWPPGRIPLSEFKYSAMRNHLSGRAQQQLRGDNFFDESDIPF